MWQIGFTVNAVILVTYLAISALILVPLIRTQQLTTNRLGLATGLIFFSCGIGHGLHAVHLIGPSLGFDEEAGRAARTAFELHLSLWDGLTACIAIYYVTLRRTYGSLMRGAAMFEDLKEKQRQALEINDNIVQGLVVAETALALDQRERSQAALEATLVSARQIISDLLGEVGSDARLGAGDLRRTRPAIVVDPATDG
jgi:hypothetical protein